MLEDGVMSAIATWMDRLGVDLPLAGGMFAPTSNISGFYESIHLLSDWCQP